MKNLREKRLMKGEKNKSGAKKYKFSDFLYNDMGGPVFGVVA